MKLTKLQKAQSRWVHDPKAKAQAGFWITLLVYVAVFILSELLRPKPDVENAKPAGLGDFEFPTATEGRPVPLIWGTVRQKGPNVVWYGDYTQEPITEEVKTGLFSSYDQIRGYRYYLGVQFALCRGPVDELRRLWVGDTEIDISGPISHDGTFSIDCPEFFGGDELGQGGLIGEFLFKSGTSDQTVANYLTGFQLQGGDTPAYLKTCYICPNAEAPYLGNSTSIKPWAFELKRIPDGLSLGGDATVNSFDANPANVIYEILTDTEWGLGLQASTIDTSNMAAVGGVLADEGNGFSYILDREIPIGRLLRLVEEQIDGIVYQDRSDGKWKIQIARDDYDIDTVPEISESNMEKLVNFSRGSWEDTTNQVRIEFFDRSDTYKKTYGFAQDSANIRTMQGVNVSVTQSFPGVKDATLANFIAWRQLRTLSYPLIKMTVEVNRSFYAVVPGDVLAFTNSKLGLTKLPMRVQRIGYGDLENSTIRIDLIQDVFTAQAPSFGDPANSGWDPPIDDLDAFESDQQLAMEAPRAFVVRDPNSNGIQPLLWCGARRQGTEVGFSIRQRNAAGTPSGAYTKVGESYQLLFIGELGSSLSAGSAVPLTSLTLLPSPDSQTAIEAAFTDATDPSELGTELVNVCVINPGQSNEEYILVSSAQTAAGNVQLNNVYRSVLDSVQHGHASGEEVWLLFVGGSMSTQPIPPTNNVDVKLTPFSSTDEVAEGDVATINFQMDNRVFRPYPPCQPSVNSTAWGTTVSLEQQGSDAEDYAVDFEFVRRDYRTLDELASLTTDAETLDGTFPAANSTVYDVEVRDDPAGTNTLLYTLSDQTGPDVALLRLQILRFNSGAVPSRLRAVVTAKHTDGGTSYEARQDLVHDFNVTTALTGQFAFGALDTNNVSNLYTATAAGTYAFTLSSAFTAGIVQYRLNSGTWTNLITAGNTSGSIVGVSISDTIEVRHTSNDVDALKQLDMTAAGAGQDGFAVLYT